MINLMRALLAASMAWIAFALVAQQLVSPINLS